MFVSIILSKFLSIGGHTSTSAADWILTASYTYIKSFLLEIQ